VALVVGAGALLTGRSAAESGFQPGTLRVDFTDPSGHPIAHPTVDVRTAAPGMAEAHTSISLRNNGTVPAAYRVVTANLVAAGPDSLDRVLVVTVEKDHEVLYRGSLSGLLVSEVALSPGEVRTYELGISWPRGPSDDHYQGESVTFSLQADAVDAVG
jgi:hypothetical protein